MNYLLRILALSVAVMLISWLLPGVYIYDYGDAIIVAFLLGILNTFLKPILVVLTIPITILTFGLFLLVINALMVSLVSRWVSGFYVDGFGYAILFSILYSFVSYLLKPQDSVKLKN